ncbi:ERF family protein [Aerococcaceae bacterium WGS1372]
MKLSESTKNIFKALADFKKQFRQPLKDANNPFFKSKYVPLENVVHSIDQVAPSVGLSYFQSTVSNDQGQAGVITVITHESGEYIEFDPLFLKADKLTAQGMGSAITYARRYSLSSAFGIASDIDDDGNHASGNNTTHKPEHSNQGREISEPTKSEALTKAKELKKSIATLKNVTQKQVDEWLFEYMGVTDAGQIRDWNKAVVYLIKLESKAKEQADG